MSKGIVTDYPEICFICGRPSEAEHHLVFGTAGRELSEKDGLKVPVCNNCHNMGEILMRIHGNPMAERMSKIIGQLAWEKEYALQKADEFARIIDEGREEGEGDCRTGVSTFWNRVQREAVQGIQEEPRHHQRR